MEEGSFIFWNVRFHQEIWLKNALNFFERFFTFFVTMFSSQWWQLVHLCFTQGKSESSLTFPSNGQNNAPYLTVIMCVLSFPSFTIYQYNLNMDALGMKIMSPIYLLKDWNLSFGVKDFVVEYLVSIIRIKLPQFHLMDTSCEGLIDFTSWIEHLRCASTRFCCPPFYMT
jgi:hypothetical protein